MRVFCHWCKTVDKCWPHLHRCIFAFIVIVLDSFPCLFFFFCVCECVCSFQLRRRGNAHVALPGQPFLHLPRKPSPLARAGRCVLVGLWKMFYCCIFWKLSHWAGPNLFIVVCQEEYFSLYSMWTCFYFSWLLRWFLTCGKKKTKEKKAQKDQIKCNTPELFVVSFVW